MKQMQNYAKKQKRITLFTYFLFSAIMFSCVGQSQVSNTIEPGKVWRDNRGIHINAHGGGLLYREGIYYWYGEHKDTDSNVANVGINCYSSKDLKNWHYEGVVLPVDNDNDSSDIAAGCIIERPKVVYNSKTGKYVLWFHLELKGKGYEAARVALAVSDNPVGPFTYLRSYRPNPEIYPLNMTEEQKQLALNTEIPEKGNPERVRAGEKGVFLCRDLAGGQMSRDMTIFVDDDLRAYHIYASEENQTLHIAELSDDYMSHTGRYVRILPGKRNEAPTIMKKDGKYYLITSGTTGWNPNAARMAVADHIFGPWTELGNPCVGKGADLTFHSQGTYIQKIPGKKDKYVFMADRWNPENPIDGRYVWLPVFFENGRPVLKWMDSWIVSE
ncbi:MAG: glycoside hydrolase family 43 protein [Paludibacter sp.]|nr:glycoside hydrolase family 43 protein [Paludibacter sp.]